MFEIKDLHVNISEVEKKIINGINLKINPGEVHAIMGPNGSGKSTLSYTLSGKEGYEIEKGDIELDGESILDDEPDERAAKGIFLAFQYPIEIPGVGNLSFIRTALNSQRKFNGKDELNPAEFLKILREKVDFLNVDIRWKFSFEVPPAFFSCIYYNQKRNRFFYGPFCSSPSSSWFCL